jgi:bifunctional pyridoxal-dependent enzyme with beta-cystathionase and maltose regulon repressor activities
MHFGAPALRERFEKRIPSRLLGSPGVTGVDATVAAWDDGQPWLDEMLLMVPISKHFGVPLTEVAVVLTLTL